MLQKALEGERIADDEALALLESRELVAVGRAADELRARKTDPGRVTFIVDRNVNYTNVCYTDCDFCAFYRSPGDTREGYLLPKAVIFKKIEETLAIGGTGLLMQGGHHPDLGVEYYEDLFTSIKARYPIHLHALSPSRCSTPLALEGHGAGGAHEDARRRARLAPRWRRRDPRRPGPRHHLAEEDDVSRVARRHAARAAAWACRRRRR